MRLTCCRINQMEIQPTPKLTEGVESVTAPAPVPVVASLTAKTKDPKKVAAGRAGAVARRARQESFLAELRTAKEAINLRSEAVAEAATPVADVFVAKQQPMHAPATHSVRHEVSKADWTPWLLFAGAGLATLYMLHTPQQHPEATHSVSSGASRSPSTPRCAQQLKVTYPFHME